MIEREIEVLRAALNEKVQHHLDAHPDCYVMSSERKNALYDRDRRENEEPLPPDRQDDVPLREKRWTAAERWNAEIEK